MKKMRTVIVSSLLCASMLVTAPAQTIASAAEPEENVYVSEVKVGMGETSEEAAKELLAEGYTILTKDDGKYADLNENAGSKSLLKSGPNQKIVYVGYKTTTDASDAITDLAVMNMNGGYSFEEYEILMNKQMEGQIKPFVNRFIATLTEYRENLKKPKDSANYKRADYYRKLLNKLTDDDTGGKPLGDLLINQTKYEMGDEVYNKLSDEEKKNHCDILTLLMQGNGQAVQLMETELTKAADAGDNTWIERFQKMTLDSLTESIKAENPSLTPSEINAELDKKYNDDAKKLLEKWSTFGEVIAGYDEAVDDAVEITENTVDGDALKEKAKALNEDSSEEEAVEVAVDLMNAEADMVKGGNAAENIVVKEYLEAIEYGDGTLLEFFDRDQSEINDEDTIRELYPIVEALSGGQIAGLDFLSIKDMIIMAVTDENGFKTVDVSSLEPASIYQGVNREIYEVGGVALTNDALRAKANAQDAETVPELSTLGIVMWTCTAAAGVAAASTAIASTVYNNMKLSLPAELKSTVEELVKSQLKAGDAIADAGTVYRQGAAYKYLNFGQRGQLTVGQTLKVNKALVAENNQTLDKIDEVFENRTNELASKSSICKYLAAGFTIAMAVLAGFSIYTTITDLMEYYKVEFVPIPKYIVDEVDITATNDKGEKVMIQNQTAYYKAVLCNRTEGKSDTEKNNYKILGERNDLNGDVGKQWLALYAVKYENGMPILADSLKVKMGKGDIPDGYSTGIHRFGEKGAFNLTSKYYCYNDPNDGTYVLFKNEQATVKELAETAEQNKAAATGSMFSAGSIAIGAVAGLLVGVIITLIITKSMKKKNEDQTE